MSLLGLAGIHVTRARADRSGAGRAGSRPGRQIEAPRPIANWPGSQARRAGGEVVCLCANPACGRQWLRLWRGREMPVFQGGRCCSKECTLAHIRVAVSREMEGWRAAEGHRHRIPLGLAMLEAGWITQADLRAALTAQRAAGTGRLGQWLIRQRRASEDEVTRALGMQWSCPVLGVESPDAEGLAALVPRLFIDACGALPLRVAADRILYMGFEEGPDPSLSLAIERITGLRVESGVVAESPFSAAQRRMLEAPFPAVELHEASTEAAVTATLVKALERARPAEARLARVHDCLWMRMWLCLQRGPVPEPGSVLDRIVSFARR